MSAVGTLLLEKVENGRVYYRNPWGSERTQGGSYTNGTALANPPRKVENQHEGIESMSEADFKKLINGATIGPPIGGN